MAPSANENGPSAGGGMLKAAIHRTPAWSNCVLEPMSGWVLAMSISFPLY